MREVHCEILIIKGIILKLSVQWHDEILRKGWKLGYLSGYSDGLRTGQPEFVSHVV